MCSDSRAAREHARSEAGRLSSQAIELLRSLPSAENRALVLCDPSPAQKQAAAELYRVGFAWAAIDLNGDLMVRVSGLGRGAAVSLAGTRVEAAGGPTRAPEDQAPRTTGLDGPHDSDARPIEEELAELAAEIPAEEWKKLPADLSDNLDHYLYGTPKR